MLSLLKHPTGVVISTLAKYSDKLSMTAFLCLTTLEETEFLLAVRNQHVLVLAVVAEHHFVILAPKA